MLPGSHHQGFVADLQTGRIPPEALQGEPVTVELAPGDAAVFGPFVVHGSGPNRSAHARRLFLQGYTLPGANRRVYPGCGTGVTRP
jgi:ectoine hydroxylase-related dioxygenase (phytanoyl-CoA dioxygenase family)